MLLVSGIIAVCSGCKNSKVNNNAVPNAPVYLVINIKAEYPHFTTDNIGQMLIFDHKRYETDYIGYAGILLYIPMDAQYHAYDLACPNCLNRVVADGFIAECDNCGEQYDLSYGYATPQNGIGKMPMKQYRCQYDGTKLIVKN